MSTNIAERTHLVWASSGTCGCGFDPTLVTPAQAVDTLRSLARRWRSALAFDLDAAEPEAVLTSRPMGGWSALEHAGHVRDVLHALSIRLQRVLREDDPVLPETHVTPPSGANEQGPGVVLAAFPYVEKREVQERLRPFLAERARAGRPTIAVCHRGVIRAVYALAVSWDMTSKAPRRLADGCAQVFTLAPDGTPAVRTLDFPLCPEGS